MTWVATVIGGVGLVDQLANSGSSPSPSQGASRIYTPTGLPNDDQWFQSLLTDLSKQGHSLNNQIDPSLYQSFLNQLGINTAPLMQGGQQAGNAATYAGNTLLGQVPMLQQEQNAIYQSAMDPQQALFNQQTQQLTDQSNAINSMYGLGSSPVGSSITTNALGNFDINWQNQQLARQTQGAQAIGGINQQIGADVSAAPGAYYAGGQYPIQGQQAAYSLPTSAAQAYTSAVQGGQNSLTNLLNPELQYLNYGTGAGASAFNADLGAANYNAGQVQGLGSLFGQGINSANNQGMLSFFGNGGGGYDSMSNLGGQAGSSDPSSSNYVYNPANY